MGSQKSPDWYLAKTTADSLVYKYVHRQAESDRTTQPLAAWYASGSCCLVHIAVYVVLVVLLDAQVAFGDGQ